MQGPFDPYYFPPQTIDFNYQIALSATVSLSACAPRSVTTAKVRLISCTPSASVCVSLWICSANYRGREFDGVLSSFCLLCLSGATVTAAMLRVKGPSQVTTCRDERFSGSVRASVMCL